MIKDLSATTRDERAVLVGVAVRGARRSTIEEYLDELALLTESAGAIVVSRIMQERQAIDSAFYIGKGKAHELAEIVEDKKLDLAIFDEDLSAVQVRNLEKIVKCKIIDRSGIILDIFASRARTREAKTQVELAQLQYRLPRLTRQWTHLSKQFGGIGTKGPGETQIETDRRAIRTKISTLKERLRVISKERAEQRKGREKFPRYSLVGYTNAGKSTLLNWFSKAGVLTEDRLFATLDATVRLVTIPPAHTILLTDTVGFIRKLPHNLVASFKSTLEEVTGADVLLHVVDVSHPLFEEHIAVVNDTLEEIGAHGKTTIMVFNKIDRLENRGILPHLTTMYGNAVFVSATRGLQMKALEDKMAGILSGSIIEQEITLTQRDHDVISRIHDMAEILDRKYDGDAITLRFRINTLHAEQLKKLLAHRR